MKNILLFLLLAAGLLAAPNTPINNALLQNRIAAAPNVVTYAATTDIDMTKALQTLSIAGDVTFTTSNKAAGPYVTVIITCDATNRTLTFPGTWIWVGSVAPATLVASKSAILTLICTGTTDATVYAAWVSSL